MAATPQASSLEFESRIVTSGWYRAVSVEMTVTRRTAASGTST
jgi:hypothetical protein